MTYGIQILNEFGAVQFDTDNVCYSLAAKGTWNASNGLPVQFTNGVQPIMAVHINSGGNADPMTVAITSIGKSGSTYTYTPDFYAKTSATYNSGWVVEWFIFDKPPTTPSTSGVGLEILNSSGQVIYSTSRPPMRVVDVKANLPENEFGATYIAGRKYAVTGDQPFYRQQVEVEVDSLNNAIITYRASIGGFYMNTATGNVAGTYDIQAQTGGVGGTNDISGGPNFMVVDVTNL